MSEGSQCPLSVMFTSKDMKRSIAFYRDNLGFELKECWPDEGNPKWASMVLGGQTVMLGAAMPPEKVGEMCADDEATALWLKSQAEQFQENHPGAGVLLYVHVEDVDAYHESIVSRDVQPATKPKSQFYGIRDFGVDDPDGYRLAFYQPIAMSECQSCGMPLADAKPGEMYCNYCIDESGKLKPYEMIFEGTVSGYFMGMKNMARAEAEEAAREHLAKMPAWVCRE
ncbi:MAG: VOC family protein [Planctomycetota bacterium]